MYLPSRSTTIGVYTCASEACLLTISSGKDRSRFRIVLTDRIIASDEPRDDGFVVFAKLEFSVNGFPV